MNLPCPGCHTPLPPEATGCQICMRSRTKQEIVRGYTKLREEKARKQRLPYQILAAVLILGAGGKLIVMYRNKITAVTGAASRWADDIRDPSHYGPKPVGAPAAAPVPAVEPPAAVPATRSNPQNYPQANDTPVITPPPLAKNVWRVSGAVFDLATLKPVPNATITFTRNDEPRAAAKTNAEGAYRIDLAKGDGWTVSLQSPTHRPGQIIDTDPSYRVRDADERRAVIAHTSDGDLAPVPIAWKRSSSKVTLDLIAVPPSWTNAPRP